MSCDYEEHKVFKYVRDLDAKRKAYERQPNTEYILSLSYGKDSIACLFAIEQLGWPLDRIVHDDYDARFAAEDAGLIDPNERFKWEMIGRKIIKPRIELPGQISIEELIQIPL